MKKTKRKLIAAAVSLALVCAVGVGGTVAWLHSSDSVRNTFTLAEVSGEVEENFDKNIKKSVKIHNGIDTEVYVRVALSASWTVDEAGTVIAPVRTEGTYTFDEDGWVQNGGYYYYTQKLPAKDAVTWNLNAQPNSNLGDEYKDLYFRLDVSVQMIQAEPDNAVTEAWGVNPAELS